MEATKLLANFPAEKQNWIVYREMTDFNTFASRLVAATMDFESTSGEAKFAEAFRSYMFELVDGNGTAVHNSDNYSPIPTQCYPDEDIGLPRDESKVNWFMLSKSDFISRHVWPLMLRRLSYTTRPQVSHSSSKLHVFRINLSMEVFHSCNNLQIQDLILSSELSSKKRLPWLTLLMLPALLLSTTLLTSCSWTTPISNAQVLSFLTRFTALKRTSTASFIVIGMLYCNAAISNLFGVIIHFRSIRTKDGYYKLYKQLPVELQPVYTVEAAANKYLFRFIVNSFATLKSAAEVKLYLKTPRRLNVSFVLQNLFHVFI